MTSLRRQGFEGVSWWYAVGVVGVVVGSATTALQPFLVGRVTESFLQTGTFPSLLFAGLAAAFAVDVLVSTSSSLLFGLASERFVLNLRNHLAAQVLDAAYADSSAYDRGDLNNRLVEDIPAAQEPYFATYPEIASSALVILFCLAGMLTTSWQLTVGLLGLLVVFGVLLVLVLRRLNHFAARSRVATASYSSFLYEVLYNTMPIKSLRCEQWATGALAKRASTARHFGNRVVGYSSLILPVVNIGAQIGLVAVLLVGGLMVTHESLTISELVSYFLYFVYMLSPLVALGIALGNLREAEASWARLHTLSQTLPAEPPAPADPTARLTTPARLVTNDLSYTYPGGEAVRLGDIDLTGPGVHCVLGSNGAGKSTLFSLLNGLRLPASGSLTWNDVALSGVTARSIRQDVLLMAQARDTLSVTVRDNICMGHAFSDEQINALAHRIGAQEFLAGLPDGLDSVIGASGIGLSGGQKQLLFVMHVLLRRPAVILLDEFSASLDARIKAAVCDEIAHLGQSSLVLMITHDEALLARFGNHIPLQRLSGEE